jgi:hypothetical protein
LREETKAVSDMAKRPLRRVSKTMTAIWKARLIILRLFVPTAYPRNLGGERSGGFRRDRGLLPSHAYSPNYLEEVFSATRMQQGETLFKRTVLRGRFAP